MAVTVTVATPVTLKWLNTRGLDQDQQTSQDFVSIQSLVSSYYQANHTTPDNLNTLVAAYPVLGAEVSFDIDQYNYKSTGPSTYQVCARFYGATQSYSSNPPGHPDVYSHGRGYQCFNFSATP